MRREAEAVARIFEKVESGSIQLVVSPAHWFENDRIHVQVEVVTPDQLTIDEESPR